MKRKLILDIVKIVPSEELKRSLFEKDYEMSLVIIAKIFNDLNIFNNEFSIFDSLSRAINGDCKEFLKLAIVCEKLFFIDVVRDVISFYELMDEISIPLDCDIVPEFFLSLTYLNRFSEVINIDYNTFFQRFISCQNKRYPKVEALEIVLSLPLVGDGVDNVLANYIESLIHGNEVTYEDVYKAIIDDDPDSLMEKFLVVKYLRELYYDLRVIEADKLHKRADSLLEIGLKREINT